MERVSLGVESFSTDVQHAMGKSSRYDDADKTCRLFADEGIKTESWIIYGYPTETDDNFKETLNWFIQNPNVLSHVTANAFGPNAKYLHDRPGIVKYNSNIQWDWVSGLNTIEKRKERFLLLMDVLETTRRARKGKFTFYFGDPLYVKYFSSWTNKDKSFLLARWDELQGIQREATGFRKILHLLGKEKTKPVAINAKEGFYEPPKEEWEIKIDGTATELSQRLFDKIKTHLESANGRSVEEQKQKLVEYKAKIKLAYQFSSATIAEDMFYARALSGPLPKMLRDIDANSSEELSKQLLLQEEKRKNQEREDAVLLRR